MDKKPPDVGFRAVSVVVGSFLCNGLIFGLVNSFSVMYNKFLQTFQENNIENATSKASLIGSLTIGTTFFLSMVAGMVSDRIGIRLTTFLGGLLTASSMLISSFCTDKPVLLCFSYGILFGTGASLAYIPSLTIVGHYFKKYIGIANGIVVLGSSLFSVAMPYILDALLTSKGLETCLRYLACMLSILILCSLIFKPVYKCKLKNSSEKKGLKAYFANFINRDIWQNKRYTIWVVAVPVALCGYFVPYVHMMKFAQHNFDGEDPKLPMVCVAVTSGLGRIIFGLLSDHKKVDNIFLQQLSFSAIGIVTILMPLTTNYFVLLGLCLILGLFDGCFITVIGPIAFRFCGPEGAGQAIGFILGLSSFPLIIGPPIAGWLHDHFNSYTIPYILSGIPPILGAALLTRIHFIEMPKENKSDWVESTQLTEQEALSGAIVAGLS